MKTAMMAFGWVFGFFSMCCLVGTADYVRRNWGARFCTFWVLGVMLSLAGVFAATWWTTWKGRPTARAWGITASLANLSIALYMIYDAHRRLTGAMGWMIAVSAFALVAYSWPDSQRHSLVAEPSEDDDSAPQTGTTP
jgi:hypothetical protein